MKTIYYLILVPMVYLAFLVFIVGTIAKLAKIFGSPKNPSSTLQIYPQKNPPGFGPWWIPFSCPRSGVINRCTGFS